MAGNTMTLEFAGDATKLQRAAKQAAKATDDVAKSAKDAGDDFKKSSQETTTFTDRIGKLGAGVTGMTDAIDTLGGGLQAVADAQDYAREKASRLARANVDVMQATEDMAQATRDAKQAQIDSSQAAVDLEQAHLDEAKAIDDYNKAVKEHGKGSIEARQAQLDLKQAGVDVAQALEDQQQATRDASQANIDAKQSQVDLNDAMHEANPPELQQWADKLNLITPLLSAVVGVVGLVTAAQWAWNAAQYANPIVLIIVAIIALIAIIVVIATKTDWFQRAWRASWGWIKKAASNTWDFLKKIPGWLGKAFSSIAKFITAPFRAAFNYVADAWNNTIGRLSWSVPGWVPFIGGNTISVPHIPKFHTGGTMPGAPGSEGLALLQAGETITPAGKAPVIEIRSGGSAMDDLLVEILSRAVRRRGGNVQTALGGRNA